VSAPKLSLVGTELTGMDYLGALIVADHTQFVVYSRGRPVGHFKSISSARRHIRFRRRLARAVLSATTGTAS
jgi:hypothetical protein